MGKVVTVATTVRAIADAGAQAKDIREDANAAQEVPLVMVLDTFRQLDDPKSRVIGGFFYGEPDDMTEVSPMDEVAAGHLSSTLPGDLQDDDSDRPNAVFTGVASPGSKVLVTIADEVGQPVDSRTVYTDAGGNWLAPFGRLSTLDGSGLVSVEVLPSTWSGATVPSLMIFDFPAEKIVAHGKRGAAGEGKYLAAVFQGAKIGDTFSDD